MCLSIPAEVLSVNGDTAEVSIGGTIYKAGLQMLENVSVGEFILLHAGFAIQKISKEEAEYTLKLLRDIDL
jgi:hydrogenase expression/formation protein HypC